MRIWANGININVSTRGRDEPALVFLHYWGGSSRTWNDVISHLGGNRRTVALDSRGWGDSDKPSTGYRIEELANDLEAVLEDLKLSRFILVGHSMGGKVAQYFAARHPAGLQGLVLVAPASPHGLQLPADQKERMIHAYDSAESASFVLDNILTNRPLSDALKAQAVEDSLKGCEATKIAWPNMVIAQDISQAAARISVPTLVIGGEFDQVDPPATLEKEVIGTIRAAQLEVVKGSGHLLPLEAAKEVSTLVTAFIEKL